MLKRRIFSLMLCVFLLVSVCGCDFSRLQSLTGNASESGGNSSGGDKTTGETVLYNGYLGLTVKIPKGYYIEYANETNLTASADESSDKDSLEWEEYSDGSYYIELISVQNKPESTNADHAYLSISADDFADLGDYNDYIDDYIYWIDQSDENYTYTVSSPENVKLLGRDFVKVTASVLPTDEPAPYIEEHYITEINGVYLIVYMNYWSDSSKSEKDAYYMLENFFSIDGGISSRVAQL